MMAWHQYGAKPSSKPVLIYHLNITLELIPEDLVHGLVNNGSGNGLVPSGNKPSYEPMFKIFVVIWRH